MIAGVPLDSWMVGDNEICFDIPQAAHPSHQPQTLVLDQGPFQNMASSFVEEQEREINQFLALQNQTLMLALRHQKRRLLAAVFGRLESKISPLLRQKDELIAQAAKRAADLEDLMRKLEVESQSWRRAAQENHAMAAYLADALEKLRGSGAGQFDASDADSCCDENDAAADGGAVAGGGGFCGPASQADSSRREMVCRVCNSRRTSVMLLPCRHLCSCTACEDFLHFCPVCSTVKNGSIDVLIF